MKGLILKDLYALQKYCKNVIIILLVFVCVGFFSTGTNGFFISYPCILGSILPVTLLAYDEKEKWNSYAQTLPVTKGQYVSGKYIIGLITTSFFLVITSIVYIIKMIQQNLFSFNEYLNTLFGILIFCLIMSAFIPPFVFKFGTQKGKIIYLTAVGIICGVFIVSESYSDASLLSLIKIPIAGVLGICVVLYVLSWILSIKFYQSREIK